eukprot:jgi/Psemu1/201066/e_gw1.271.51.1
MRTKAQERTEEVPTDENDDVDNGYDIRVLTVTGRSSSSGEETNNTATKSPLLLVTSTHAREYTPPELVRRWLQNLIDRVDERDPDALSLLEHTQIHWIPYLNPDGRVRAETTQPFRRKNLNSEWTGNFRESLVCSKDAFGVDLNRNFPFEWGNNMGSDAVPCSSYSRGSAPGSEPETKALVGYATAIFPGPQQARNAVRASGGDYRGFDPQTTRGVFVDVHSYGKVYIYPWGNTNAISPNDSGFRSIMGHIGSLTGLTPLGP